MKLQKSALNVVRGCDRRRVSLHLEAVLLAAFMCVCLLLKGGAGLSFSSLCQFHVHSFLSPFLSILMPLISIKTDLHGVFYI